MNRQLRIALVGHKFMGRAHSNAWRQVGRFFDLPFQPVMKVICGRDAAAVGQAAQTLGWEESSTSWQQVVERPDIDAVDICTPGLMHLPIALAAAAAGKAILCEKPLARDTAEAEEMLAAVRREGGPRMAGHNYRRVPAVALARELMGDAGAGAAPGEGRIGRVFHFRAVYLHDR